MQVSRSIAFVIIFAAAALLAWLFWRPDGGVSALRAAATPQERLIKGQSAARTAGSMSAARGALEDMRRALRQMSVEEARAWILSELLHGEDFSTAMDLTVGTDQNLAGWPSYRVFLLDMLFLVDPAAAAEKARELLNGPPAESNADEWAVAMRNLARSAQVADTALLQAKSAELLQRNEWREKPSAGYLEAFDVIVHLRHTALTPELLRFCEDRDHKAVRHASFLTLDRLVMAKPAEVLPKLDDFAAAHPGSRLMISNMMARADVRDAAQRAALETYLMSPDRTAEELRGFASVFPNGNVAVSQNLLTRAPVLQGSDLAEQDRAALEAVTGWLADPRFAQAQEALRLSHQRLRSFTQAR